MIALVYSGLHTRLYRGYVQVYWTACTQVHAEANRLGLHTVAVLAAFDVFFFWRAGQRGDALLTIHSCPANCVRGCSIKQYLNGFYLSSNNIFYSSYVIMSTACSATMCYAFPLFLFIIAEIYYLNKMKISIILPMVNYATGMIK